MGHREYPPRVKIDHVGAPTPRGTRPALAQRGEWLPACGALGRFPAMETTLMGQRPSRPGPARNKPSKALPVLSMLQRVAADVWTLQAFLRNWTMLRRTSGRPLLGVDALAHLCPPQIFKLSVIPNGSRRRIKRSFKFFQASIRDASHRGPTSPGPAHPPPSDDGFLAPG